MCYICFSSIKYRAISFSIIWFGGPLKYHYYCHTLIITCYYFVPAVLSALLAFHDQCSRLPLSSDGLITYASS